MGAIDIKLYAMNAGTLALSMTNIEPVLKIILLLVTIGYTIHRWLELVNKKKNK